MKKQVLLFAFAAISAVGYSQQNKVVSAYNYHRYYNERGNKLDDLLKAQEAIDEAANHELSMGSSKTWFYRAMIYHSLYDSKDQNLKPHKFTNLSEAVRSYRRCLEIDTKKEYLKECNLRLNIAQAQFVNIGIDKFEEKDFINAMAAFEGAVDLKASLGKIDTLAMYNAALASEKAGNLPKAAQHYNKLIEINHGGANTYAYLINIYRQMNDEAKAHEVVVKGRAAYPNDKSLIIEELNFYLKQGKLREAINNLELAIQADPKNHILAFSTGSVYDNLANPPKDKPQPKDDEYNEFVAQAEKNYLKAIELKADYFDALYNLGALYFNQAVKINDASQDIKDNKKYAEEQKKADEKFAQSLPYLEKAHDLDAKDINTLVSLKQLYARTGDLEKFKKIKGLLGQ
jgi:tetratricopeptide (TPR) repeat protein